MLNRLLKRYENFRPFTENEAWGLFRIAAIAEACGWSLLILGIICKRYIVHGNNIPVLIAGQIHGTIFLTYIVAAIVLYPSLRWPRVQALTAALVSIPPYGTLIFELWAAHTRHTTAARTYWHCFVYATLSATGQSQPGY